MTAAPRAGIETARAHARELVLLFVVALVLRLAAMGFLHSTEQARGKDAWSFGYESACIAQSLVDGHGYAGPWTRAEPPWAGTEPTTGWLTPIYPGLVAACMKIGGGVTPLAAGILLGVQCILSALTCLFLWGLGAVLGDLRLARLAGWIFALYPAAIWNSAHTVWDTTCIAFALTLFVELLLRFGRGASVARCVGLGLVFGALMLVNPAPGSIAPVALVVLAHGVIGIRGKLVRVGVFALAAGAVCLPWCWRNQVAVGSFALRTNLGVEFMVGNNDQANGYFQTSLHPSYSPVEYRRYLELGEVRYAEECMTRAKDWMRANPGRWARLTMHRGALFWVGDFPTLDPRREGKLAPAEDAKSWIKWAQHLTAGILCLAGAWSLSRRSFEGRALLAMLLLFPAPYYLTHVLERYRFPIEPLIVLCASTLVLAAWDRARGRRRSAAA